jgi:tetratricopeptide repeat protein
MDKRRLRSVFLGIWVAFIAVRPLVFASASAAAPSALGVTINWSPAKPENENAIWLAYLAARTAFMEEHKDLYEQKTGTITPIFAEEVEARTTATQVYREMRQKDKELNAPYFNDLDRVASGSYMREYVWTYLHQPTWGAAPGDLKLAEFDVWRQTNLPHHQATTKGSISFGTSAKTAAVTSAGPGKEYTLLIEGRQVLQQGNPQRAVTEYFEPVIDHYEVMYKGSTSRIYSAQNQVQMIIYSALPAGDKQSVEVLDTEWADAYLLKAYALTELKRIPEAQKALESAIALSPMNSQYLSELAYTYQAQKDCDKSIATYMQAASMAELASDDATKTINLTRTWRGEGYCLVEQGKFDEAEAMYKKCLALDPKDNKAKGELEYIRGLRQK